MTSTPTDVTQMTPEMAELFGIVCKMSNLRMRHDDILRTDGGLTAIINAAGLVDEIVDTIPALQKAFYAAGNSHRLAHQPGDGAGEVSWLIEGSHIFPHVPHWWHPTKGWLPDANEALRFAREIDAAEFAKSMTYGAGGTATEHVFIEGARP